MRQLSLMSPPLNTTLPVPAPTVLLDETRQQLVEKLAQLMAKSVVEDGEDGEDARCSHER